MNLESSHNYYYRYIIHDSEPYSLRSHERKILKAKKNTTTHLILDLSKCIDLKQLNLSELISNTPFLIHYLIKPDLFKTLESQFSIKIRDIFFYIETLSDLNEIQSFFDKNQNVQLICSPKIKNEFVAILNYFKIHPHKELEIYWSFEPYNPHLKRSVSLFDIYSSQFNFKTLPGLEIFNSRIKTHYELETLTPLTWQFKLQNSNLLISIVIPSFNNVMFLTNVITHLIHQQTEKTKYEIIIVEDGGTDQSSDIIFNLFKSYLEKLNLKFIYWPKMNMTRGEQNFFRAGLARNLAMQYCESDLVVFLDSDMLVPHDFINECLTQLQTNDIIQFQRYHVEQKKSLTNPTYKDIRIEKDTYIEERNYWSDLFFTDNWMSLPFYWKYTCTYALGIKKVHFNQIGRFKKYYISYGFEDTDLGYEAYKRNFKFKLVKKPLFHLTSYDKMQYKNSQFKRLSLLRKTAALFYLQHLDKNIYEHFGNFYKFEKTFFRILKDLL